MDRVRLGLIGMGLIGTPHARTLQRVEECDLVAVADLDEQYRDPTEKLGARFYQDYEEMIRKESLQGVVGTAGIFNMSATDHNGLALDAFEMLTVKDGKFAINKK